MNLFSVLLDKFWGIAGNIISFNYFSDILKQNYISKVVNNTNFHHSDDFLHIVIEALTIILYMYIEGCQIIDFFQS